MRNLGGLICHISFLFLKLQFNFIISPPFSFLCTLPTLCEVQGTFWLIVIVCIYPKYILSNSLCYLYVCFQGSLPLHNQLVSFPRLYIFLCRVEASQALPHSVCHNPWCYPCLAHVWAITLVRLDAYTFWFPRRYDLTVNSLILH